MSGASQRPPRVLVADDSASILDLVSRALRLAGFVVAQASDGFEAVRVAPAFGPDVMVVDVMMPGGDGFRVVEELRSAGHTCPVLYISASDLSLAQLRAVNAAGDRFLGKPFALRDLIDQVGALARSTHL